MTLKLNGSSSGSVSIDAPASTTGGADVALTLPVDDGNSNEILATNGSGALSWSKAGKIIQVVYGTHTGSVQTASANQTWTDVSPTVSITPTANTSKIKITVGCMGVCENNNTIQQALMRQKASTWTSLFEQRTYEATDQPNPINFGLTWIDDPYGGSGTVGQLDYKCQLRVNADYTKCKWNYDGNVNAAAIMILEEISA